MAQTKHTTKSNGNGRERAAITNLAQATRMLAQCLREVWPGSLTDEVQQRIEVRLREAENALAYSE